MTPDIHQRANGRYTAVSGPPMHTFKDSGVAVKLRKLSPMTGQEIYATVSRELDSEKPQPPIVEVDYGQGKISTPHEGDPIYQERLAAWTKRVSSVANERLFMYAALAAVDLTIGEHERAQIERTKRYLKLAGKVAWTDDPDLTPAENDQLFYMTHVACGSAEDLQEFYQAIAMRSQPTEAAIERHKDSFPSDVSRPVDLGL